jgi:hypothetical protein
MVLERDFVIVRPLANFYCMKLAKSRLVVHLPLPSGNDVMGDEVRTEENFFRKDNHNQQLYRSQCICPITGQHSLPRNSDTRTAIDPPYG